MDDLFKISTTFHLKLFQSYLLEQIDSKYIENSQNFNDDLIVILNVFNKYNIHDHVRKIMVKGMVLESLDQALKPSFKALDKKLQMEIMKNSILKDYHANISISILEFTMIVFKDRILHDFHL